eukprot:GDKJ01061249.1.p1 GENE.GDKJ01061249.1~~GDKJ01061249.1.p1  ORF type:complete len:375 (+),score=93.56 GDKJ01061249.1:27-1151(+)
MVSLTPELEGFLSQSLYHQFTEGVFELFRRPENAKHPQLIEFVKRYVSPKSDHLNLVKYSNIVRLALEGLKSTESLDELENFKEVLLKDKESEIMFYCIKARLFAAVGRNVDSLEALNVAEKKLDVLFGVDLSISGAFHLALAHQARFKGDWERVYKEGNLFLQYTSLNTLQKSDIAEIAELISVAALAAPRVVDIFDWSQHSAMTVLAEGELSWLVDLVQNFSGGNISGFEKCLASIDNILKTHPVLNNPIVRKGLSEKIRLLALVDLAFNQPSKHRTLTFSQISNHCKLNNEMPVEKFVMKANARGLVKAEIDGVEEKVKFSWVKPQIFTKKEQIRMLRDRVEIWANEAERLVKKVGELNPEIGLLGAVESV